MRRRTVLLVSPPAALAVLVAGFVGYGTWSRSKPVHYARGGAFPADVPAAAGASGQPVATARATPGAPDATGGPSALPTAAADPVGAAPPAAPARAAQPRTARARPVAPATRAVPVAGTYRVSVSGSEQVRFGPVSFCSRDFPASTEWAVHHADGEGAGVFALDQRYFPGQEGQHDERHLYRYSGGDVLLEFEQATVTCAGQRQSTDVDFSPAQLRIRGPLRVGDSWSSTGGDAQRTESATSRVLRTEPVTVAGRDVATYVVETHVDISGSESGTRTQRWWWAPSLALPVRVFEEISAQRSGGQYTSSATTTVTALPPGA